MVLAMLLGGLRRCEVLGLQLADISAGERRLFIAEGKGGRQRIVPVSPRFFAALGDYLGRERPASASTGKVFVVLKGPRVGQPLTAAGLDEILDGARAAAQRGPQPGQLLTGQPACHPARDFRSQRSLATSPPATPPLTRLLRTDPQLVRHLLRAGILLIHLPGLQPHALTPGPPSSGQATIMWIPHDAGADPPPGPITQARRT